MLIKARFCLFILPAICLLGAIVSQANARDAAIKLDDGRLITGELLAENEKEVVLNIAGIRTTFPRESVKNLTYVKSIEDQYRERRSTIADTDVDKRYELVRWLFENKQYNLSKKELEALIASYPKDGRLVPLQKLIDARIKLLEEPAATGNSTSTPATSGNEAQPAATGADGKPVRFDAEEVSPRLNDDQINLIKVYDVDLSKRPRVNVPNDVMEDVYKNYAGQENVPVGTQAQRQALGSEGWRKLQLLFDLRARELYSRVTVYNDPQTVQDFKINIHSRYLLSYCASNSCHGGKNAGNFLVYRYQPGSNATVYTNYYILNRYNNNSGYMLDREKPELSLLIQYGLNRSVAKTPHPDVPGFRPIVQNLQEETAQRVIGWVQSLGITSTEYPISYQIPRVDSDGKVVTTPAPAAPAVKPAS